MLRTRSWLTSIFVLAITCAPACGGGSTGGGSSCALAPGIQWSGSAPTISPRSDATHDLVAVKDPTVVQFNGRWHVFASSVSTQGAYNMVYSSFSDWSEASTAPLYYMDQTSGFNTYVAAPELFYFRPQKKWYLVFQSGPPMYSSASDPGDPTAWAAPKPFFAATPPTVAQYGGNWLDFWVICDDASCHLFFSDNHGRWFHSKTPIDQFPNGFGDPVVVLQDSNAGRVFEASNVYKLNGTNHTSRSSRRSTRRRTATATFARGSRTASRAWLPWQASGAFPFAGERNVSFAGGAWTR